MTIRPQFEILVEQPFDGANSGLVDVIFEGTDFNGVFHRQVVATLAPVRWTDFPARATAGQFSPVLLRRERRQSIPDRDFNQDGILDRNETVGCLKSNISPLNPQLLREDPESFLPDGFGPVNVILRFEENLPNEGCQELAGKCLDHSRGMGPVHKRAWKRPLQTEDDQQRKRVLSHWANNAHRRRSNCLHQRNQPGDRRSCTKANDCHRTTPRRTWHQLDQPKHSGHLRDDQRTIEPDILPDRHDGHERTILDPLCPLSDVMAGKAKVSVTYSSYDNNDAYRYENKTVQTEFDVFSNSTLGHQRSWTVQVQR